VLSEHKQSDLASTNVNRKNANSRMEASSAGSVRTGAKKDKSNTGGLWAPVFHHVTARCRLARVLKLIKRYLFIYSIFNFYFWLR
jgi:hypothetical protein